MGVSDSVSRSRAVSEENPGLSSFPESPLHWKRNSSIEELFESAPSWQDQLYQNIHKKGKLV